MTRISHSDVVEMMHDLEAVQADLERQQKVQNAVIPTDEMIDPIARAVEVLSVIETRMWERNHRG